MSVSDSDEDEHAARQWDLRRLHALLTPHLPDSKTPIWDAFPHMTPADRAETLEILDRLGDITEDPEVTQARQKILLDYARMEPGLRDLIANPGPLVDDDGIVYGPDGQPVPNEHVRQQARELLAELERERARLSGIPLPPGDGNT